MLAPFWTDLKSAAGGALRIGTLTDGVSSWVIVDFEGVREYSTTRTAFPDLGSASGAVEDITFTYGRSRVTETVVSLTVGAENEFGNSGQNYYANGTGTLPAVGTELRVTSIPGAPGEKAVSSPIRRWALARVSGATVASCVRRVYSR